MTRTDPLLAPREPEPELVRLRFDERLVEARACDSLSTALIACGELMTSRSPKYRRPRGPYCLSGDCGTCLVRVDGQPNVRACMTPIREGMRASSQNSYRPTRLDPTQLVDALFRDGLDHHHLVVRPRIANQVMQAFARNLAGFGELPEGVDERAHDYRVHELPALIIGAGPAGRAAAEVLSEVGVSHMIVDRFPAEWLSADQPGDPLPRKLLPGTGVFAIYPGPQVQLGEPSDLALVAASERRPGVERLHALRPRHLILATGSRDPMLPFANNDLPGVVAARGLVRALRRSRTRINGRCVVVGEGPYAEAMHAALAALVADDAPPVEQVAPDEVERALGGDRVEALECRGRTISCALVAVAGPPAAAHELAAQAGAPIRFDGRAFVVDRDGEGERKGPRGRCGTLGGTTLWAAGDLCGYLGEPAAARDGAQVGAAVLEALAHERGEDLDHRQLAPTIPPQPPAMRERKVVGDRFADPGDT